MNIRTLKGAKDRIMEAIKQRQENKTSKRVKEIQCNPLNNEKKIRKKIQESLPKEVVFNSDEDRKFQIQLDYIDKNGNCKTKVFKSEGFYIAETVMEKIDTTACFAISIFDQENEDKGMGCFLFCFE